MKIKVTSKEPKKNGRPSNFRPEMINQAEDYLINYMNADDPETIPTIAGLALKLDIPREKVYEYMKKDEKFRNTVEKISKVQERRLVTNGLNNKYNASIAKLLLAGHGYKEEQRVEHGADESLTSKIDAMIDSIGKILK